MDGIRFARRSDVPRPVAPAKTRRVPPPGFQFGGDDSERASREILHLRRNEESVEVASGVVRLVAVGEGPHLGMRAQRLPGGNRTGSSRRSDGHVRKFRRMDASRRQLAFPRGLDQSFVILEVLRGCVVRLVRHAGRPPLAVGQVVRLELFDAREDSFRGRPDRPAAHVPVKDLRKRAGLGGQDRRLGPPGDPTDMSGNSAGWMLRDASLRSHVASISRS